MTDQPFKFRHLDAIVGSFVVGGVVIVVAALLLVGHARQFFTLKDKVLARTSTAVNKDLSKDQLAARLEFYEELAESLRPGTPVELSGRQVGQVEEASIEHGCVNITMYIEREALGRLHQDAHAVIKMPLAPFMGQTRVLLKAGYDEGKLVIGEHMAPLPIDPPRDSTAMAMAVLRDLESNLGPLMSSITALVNESRGMVVDVRSQRIPQQAGEFMASLKEQKVPERAAALLARAEQISAHMEGIAAAAERLATGLDQGRGLAGKALRDENLATDLTRLAHDLRAITAEIRRASPAIPQLTDNVGTLLTEVQRLVDGINRHWLLRSYTDIGDPTRLIPSGIVAPPADQPVPTSGAKP
ncbi:MAG: MlaD family protein [Planctomycetota bacterium]